MKPIAKQPAAWAMDLAVAAGINCQHEDTICVDCVAHALQAERDKAVRIVENFSWILPMYESKEMNEATDDAACEVVKQVAEAIRKGLV